MDYDIIPVQEGDWSWIVDGSLDMVRANAYPEDLRGLDLARTRLDLAMAIDERRGAHAHRTSVAVGRRGRRLGFSWVDLAPRDAEAPEALLVGTFVERRCRRRGVGRALARTALNWARDRGAPLVEASIGGAHGASQAFHAALGFRARSVVMEWRP